MAVGGVALDAAQHEGGAGALLHDRPEAARDAVDAHPVEALAVEAFERFVVLYTERAVGSQLS